MKTLIALLMAGVSCLSMAEERIADVQQHLRVEHYSYSSHLDIAKVIDKSPVPETYGVVPVQMTYEDHQGQRHTMEYLVMGNGCSKS